MLPLKKIIEIYDNTLQFKNGSVTDSILSQVESYATPEEKNIFSKYSSSFVEDEKNYTDSLHNLKSFLLKLDFKNVVSQSTFLLDILYRWLDSSSDALVDIRDQNFEPLSSNEPKKIFKFDVDAANERIEKLAFLVHYPFLTKILFLLEIRKRAKACIHE